MGTPPPKKNGTLILTPKNGISPKNGVASPSQQQPLKPWWRRRITLLFGVPLLILLYFIILSDIEHARTTQDDHQGFQRFVKSSFLNSTQRRDRRRARMQQQVESDKLLQQAKAIISRLHQHGEEYREEAQAKVAQEQEKHRQSFASGGISNEQRAGDIVDKKKPEAVVQQPAAERPVAKKSEVEQAAPALQLEQDPAPVRKFKPGTRPPLDLLVSPNNNSIVGDPQFLLDFALIGFGRQHQLIHWLNQQQNVSIIQEPVWSLTLGKPHQLVRRLYNQLPPAEKGLRRGYHSPVDISMALQQIRTWFPQSKLLIGIRHPVLWFQSLYNQHLVERGQLPHPNKLIGPCIKDVSHGTCTEKANFARDLMRLAKSRGNNVDNLEERILWPRSASLDQATERIPNQVFLYEQQQLADKALRGELEKDLRKFLGLPADSMVTSTATEEVEDSAHKIDICAEDYIPVRQELMRIARLNSQWIRQVFVRSSPDIHESSHLRAILEGWMHDPCGPGADAEDGDMDGVTDAAAAEDKQTVVSNTQPQGDLETVKDQVPERERQYEQILDGISLDYQRPTLDSILSSDHKSIVGDAQFLLDFAVIGFGRCGATSMMQWLAQHPQLQSLPDDTMLNYFGKPERLVARIYENLPQGHYKRGYQCPSEIKSPTALRALGQHWPKATLIVGVRHPVWFFQHFYNYKVSTGKYYPDPNSIIGRCRPGGRNMCTDKASFAVDLLRLGKQNANGARPMSDLEIKILASLEGKKWYNSSETASVPNQVLLYDAAQLEDTNRTRIQALSRDMQRLLDLRVDFPLEIPRGEHEWTSEEIEHSEHLIDICDEEYIPVREELLKLGRYNSRWIRETFLNLPGVHVSSPDYVEALLDGWTRDPCGNQIERLEKEREAKVELPESADANPAQDAAAVEDASSSTQLSPQEKEAKEKEIMGKALVGYSRPPLNELIDNDGNIIGDPQFLVDFGIIGFGKCGTSTLMTWLGEHPQIQCIQEEVWSLSYGKPAQMVKRMYEQLPPGHFTRGYKCPEDIKGAHVMRYYRETWPKAKLFIGIRHPVRWFQSLYNFRVQNLNSVPHPNTLIGYCFRGMKNTCTERGNFGRDLMRLGKLNTNGVPQPMTQLEEDILGKRKRNWFNASEVPFVPNEVFLFDIAQLADEDEARSLAFRKDVQNFLGLDTILPPMHHYTPGKSWNATVQAEKDSRKIDICEDEYIPVRRALLEIGRRNSQWIRQRFLNFQGVRVSSPVYFDQLMESWNHDPCGNQIEELDKAAAESESRENVAKAVGLSSASDRSLAHMDGRPPLEKVVDTNGEIVGDAQFLLDFSIIGFGKCGTSTLMTWLGSHPQIQCVQEEVWSMSYGKPDQLVKRLYKELPPGPYKRGYKCPEDIRGDHVMRYYREIFPSVKVFIGVRHPILWFQSLYNFRVQNLNSVPHPNKLIGVCFRGMKNVCTDKGNYGRDLMRLGKQNADGPRLSSRLEEEIMGNRKRTWFNISEVPPIPNEVFLFDLAQLGDEDPARSRSFRADVQRFLGLGSELPDMHHEKPGKSWNATVQAEKDARKIDICKDEYIPVRNALLRMGCLNSVWIRKSFIKFSRVNVANPKHFDELVASWMRDPCGSNQTDQYTDANASKLEIEPLPTSAGVKIGPPVDVSSVLRKFNYSAEPAAKEALLKELHSKALINYQRPPLNKLYNDEKIVTADAQFLLDFAIIGFGKCGTTSLMSWLGQHPELQCIQDEVWALIWGKPYKLIKSLYNRLPPGFYKRGYKCPSDIKGPHVMKYLKEMWPKVKLFIGVRHPILWFQSLYNFRVQNLNEMLEATKLVGACMRGSKGTCSSKSNYGLDLLRLGKQNMNGPRPFHPLEMAILKRYRSGWYNSTDIEPIPNEVFLFDVGQLADANATRMRQFGKDIQDYLGLQVEMPEMQHHSPGKEWNATVQAQKDSKKIDICEEKFIPLRRDLLLTGTLNSMWIRQVFIKLPGVHISTPEYFHELLDRWTRDPCVDNPVVLNDDDWKKITGFGYAASQQARASDIADVLRA